MTAQPTMDNHTSNDEGAVTDTLVAAPAAPHGYLNHPHLFGYQPEARRALAKGDGGLRYHAFGCRVDGGAGLPAGTCQKCGAEESIEARFLRQMMRADRWEA